MNLDQAFQQHSEVLSTTLAAALFVIFTAMALAFWRLLKGPTLPDRVIALDMMVVQVVAFMAYYSILVAESAFLDVGIALALVGFLGTTAFARYVEKKTAGVEPSADPASLETEGAHG